LERKWSIRAYKEGDEKGIFRLDKAVHPSEASDLEQWMRWWQWMYKKNPHGAAKIWLADYNGTIVGQYPLIFMKMKIGNEILRVSQNIDLMTHPNYRYQGMFSKLERHALDEAEREGIYITIGFPNKAAYPGHIKSGWFDIGTIRLMLKTLNWRNVLKAHVRNKYLLMLLAIGTSLISKGFFRTRSSHIEGLTISQVPCFDDRIDDFWDRISNQYKIMVVRDKDYLNWRYGTPDVSYSIFVAEKGREILGYLVLRYFQQEDIRVARIFDIAAQSEEIIHCLVSKAVEYCEQQQADLIYYAMIANKTYLRTLRKNGFFSLPFRNGGQFCAYSSSPHISRAFLQDHRNWLVQIGDSDAA